MKLILTIIIIFFLIVFQSSLYPYFKVYNAFPNLILILVLTLGVLRGYKKSLAWIIVGGIFLDIFSFNNPIGISALGLFLVGYLGSFFSQNIFKKTDIVSVLIFGIGGTLIYRLFLMLVLLIINVDFQFSFSQLISQIIFNLIILLPLFYLLKRILDEIKKPKYEKRRL